MGRNDESLKLARVGTYAAGPRLVANIGATTARFALEVAPGAFEQPANLPCADYSGVEAVCRAYLEGIDGPRPLHAAMALSNPIDGDIVRMTNRDWQFSIEAVRGALGMHTLLAVNDFVAMAMALPKLTPNEKRLIGGSEAHAEGVIGLIGASTGLGVSALIPNGERWATLASEGGHMAFSPANETELIVLRHAWRRWSHVSSERLISAPGLVLIREALAADEGLTVHIDSPDEVLRRGLLEGDALSRRALDCLCGMLGTAAANVAVMLNATGGIYVGSALVRGLAGFIEQSSFRRAFEDKGRYTGFVSRIPTYLVLSDQTGLCGAAEVLRNHLQDHADSGQLLERIRAGMDSLSPAERRVASLVLEQPRTVLNDPVAEIAAKAEVSQPTVIRFCRSLGMQGLSDFKLKLASGLTAAVPVRHSQVRIGDPGSELVAKIFNNTSSAITKLRDQLDGAAIERAIDLLAAARRIELYGVGNSSVAALDGQHKFFRFSIPSNAYIDSHIQLMAARLLGPGDVVVAISKSGSLAETLQAADAALQAGAAVIAITAAGSALAQRATVALEVAHPEEGAGYLSMVSRILHLLLIDVLAVGVAMRRITATGELVEERALQRELESLQARFEALISHAS
ncbi:glucokinase [Thauera sp.]|uniref:glucokinase n=1 Tax=Thauera sp. TaxID=1905334 RepID=UPI0025833464|nr:glucokinase [Thauera sp.]